MTDENGKLAIVNAALVLIDALPIDLIGNTNNATVNTILQSYDDEIKEAFAQYRWRWCATTEPLVKITDTNFRIDYQGLVPYQIPNDAIEVLKVWLRDNHNINIGYEIDNRAIWAVDEPLVVRYTRQLPIREFPVSFKKFVEAKIALRAAHRHNTDKIQQLTMLYERLESEARSVDARSGGPEKGFLGGGRYVNARNVFDGGRSRTHLNNKGLEYWSGRV